MIIKLHSEKHGDMNLIIDDEDYDLIKDNIWTLWKAPKKHVFYARAHCKKDHKKTIFLHRIILNAPDKMIVDHKNRNGLDNRRSNLRICTTQENKLNSKMRSDNLSGLKGVHITRNNKYMARISVNKKRLCLGTFETPQEAYNVYCNAVDLYHGEYGRKI